MTSAVYKLRLNLLTGHEDGKLVHLYLHKSSVEYRRVVKEFKHKIVAISYIEGSACVATDDALLNMIDMRLSVDPYPPPVMYVLDLSMLPFKLRSLKIKNIYGSGKHLVLCTYDGDFVKIDHKPRKELKKNTVVLHVSGSRIRNILKFEQPLTCALLIEKPGGEGAPAQRVLMAGSLNSALATVDIDLKSIDELSSPGDAVICMDAVAFPSGGLLMAIGTAQGKVILRFDWENIPNHFQAAAPVKCIKLTRDAKYLVAAAEDGSIYLFTNTGRNFFGAAPKVIRLEKEYIMWVSLGSDSRLLLLGSSNRTIYKLKIPELNNRTALQESDRLDLDLIIPTCSKHPILGTSVLALGKQVWFSANGDENGLLTFWSGSELSSNCGTIVRGHTSRISSLLVDIMSDSLYSIGLNDGAVMEWSLAPVLAPPAEPAQLPVLIKHELNFIQQEGISHRLQQSLSWVRGTVSVQLNSILSTTLEPLDEMNTLQKRYPRASIKLKHVLGFECFRLRNSLCILETNEELSSAHIVSRLVVLQPLRSKTQRFFEQHAGKVTCIAAHPSRKLGASGSAEAEGAMLLVWQPLTLEVYSRVLTGHKKAINCLKFCQKGLFLASTSADDYNTIQVTDWKYGRTVAFRHTGSLPVLDIEFTPQNRYQLVTGCQGSVSVWKIENRALILTSILPLMEPDPDTELKYRPPAALCLSFLSFLWESKPKNDLLVGTSTGDIVSLLDCQQFELIKPRAHLKAINCLRVIGGDITRSGRKPGPELGTPLIITGGEDEFIKVWTVHFDLLTQFNLRECDFTAKPYAANFTIGVQSLDAIFINTRSAPQGLATSERSDIMLPGIQFLVGTRSGEMIELSLKLSDVFEKSGSSRARYHSSQLTQGKDCNMLRMCTHPKLPIAVTAGMDRQLAFWKLLDSYSLLQTTYLGPGATATALIYSPDGNLLLVGMSDGNCRVYRAGISGDDLRSVIDLLETISGHDQQTVLLAIEFASTGHFLAISYGGIQASGEIQGFIRLFIDRDFAVKTNAPGIKEHDPTHFIRRTEIRIPTGLEAKQMSFSEDSRFFLLYSQPLDTNFKDGIYMLWDLTANSSVNVKLWGSPDHRLEAIRFPYHVFGCYSYVSTEAEEKMQVTSIHDANSLIFLGDTQGQIHVVKSSSLSFAPSEVPENIHRGRLCQARSFAGHTNRVMQICQSADKQLLLTTSVDDECIIIWELNIPQKSWEFDHLEYDRLRSEVVTPVFVVPKSVTDVFAHLKNIETIYKSLTNHRRAELELVAIREEVALMKTQTNAARGGKEVAKLSLQSLIGRKGKQTINNLHISSDGHILTHAGPMFVITPLKHKGQGKRVQHLLDPDVGNSFSVSGEVTAMAMDGSRTRAIMALKQATATLVVWDVPTRSFINKVMLPDLMAVSELSVGQHGQIVCLGHSVSGKQAIYLVDGDQGELIGLCSFELSHETRIKGLVSSRDTSVSFYSLGVQHMSYWELKGGILAFEELQLAVYKDQLANVKPEELTARIEGESLVEGAADILAVKCTFTCGIFVGPLLVVGGEDGVLYVWINNLLCHIKTAHEGVAITCLDYSIDLHTKSPGLDVFGSGSANGQVKLWIMKMQADTKTYEVEAFQSVSISNSPWLRFSNWRDMEGMNGPSTAPKAIRSSDLEIQSLKVLSDQVLVGTRSGDVHNVKIITETSISLDDERVRDAVHQLV